MEGIDYNLILQDYLDDLSEVNYEFKKAMVKINENSNDVEKLLNRVENRESNLLNYYEINGYLGGHNPQETQICGKIEKELRNSLSKVEENKMKLLNVKLMLKKRLAKMDQEALIWDPSSRNVDVPLEGPPGRRRSSHGSNLGEARGASRTHSSLPRNSRKASRGPYSRDIKSSRMSEASEDMIDVSVRSDEEEEVEDDEDSGSDGRLYCFCNRRSFGEMVGCDGEDCPHEWFHYECVGLVEPPNGSWHCPSCSLGLPAPYPYDE